MSQHTEDFDSSSTDEEIDIEEDEHEVDINWSEINKEYEVVSQGDGGFDRVTRPDLKSAQQAATAHEEATGNEVEINLL